jgi:cytochrome c oxidase cbb3-type subunit 3
MDRVGGWRNGVVLAAMLPALVLLCGCRLEDRETRPDPPVAEALNQVLLMPNGIGGSPPEVYEALGRPYRDSSFHLSQGKRLYEWFGCQACHADGQGGSGPSLIDGWWNYGPDLPTLYTSIRDGRPGGMPAFRDRLTYDQIWQLAAYVQAMGAYSGSVSAPGRSDRPQTRPAENRLPAASAPLR